MESNQSIQNLLSSKARKIAPYKAGEQPQDKKYIKLNTNENPYPPAPEVAKAIAQIDLDSLRLYPDPESVNLRAAIAKKEKVNIENVFVGNGSDEVLALAFAAFFQSNSLPVLFPDVTYSFYPVYCKLFDINYETKAVKGNFVIRESDYFNASSSGIVIANPNAPTSLLMSESKIESIVSSNPGIVVIVDEAYSDFASFSAVAMTEKYDNLVVTKTFSKSYSLAGMRCGYCIASEKLIEGLNIIKNSFNSYPINRVTAAVCKAAIESEEYFKKCVNLVVRTRTRVKKQLEQFASILLSSANFLFVRFNNVGGEDAYKFLKERGILVRHFNNERIKDYVRITIGRDEEMDAFVEVARNMCGTAQ